MTKLRSAWKNRSANAYRLDVYKFLFPSFLLVASDNVWNWVARCCLWPGFCQSRSMESPQSASRPTDLAFSFTFISARLALETFHSRTKSSSVWRSISAFCRSRFEHGLEIEIKKWPRQFNIKKRRLISGILLKKEKMVTIKTRLHF